MKVLIVKCLCIFLTLARLKKMRDKAVEKDSKMLKYVSDYFKTQEMCQKAVKKLFFGIIHLLDQHKTH